MKKFVVLSLISFLILAFGATVYGQEKAPALEFKASGFIDMITEYNMNVPQPGSGTSATGDTSINNVLFSPPVADLRPGGDGFDEKRAYMESRGRLKFDAIMGKEMSGTFQFEFDSTRWGERAPAGAQRNFAGHWGVSDRSALELKHMYFTFGVPWIPVQTTVIAGIQPIGIRPGVFLSTDGPGITAAFKIDPATIKFVWAKALENRDWEADDADLYALEANAKISTLTVGGYALLFNMNSYPVADAADPNARSDMWWYGLYADGKLGPLNLNFDVVYDRGKVEDRSAAPKARDIDFRGWAARVNIGFPWEKFLFGFASIYGSGADLNKTSATALPGDPVASGTGAISSKAQAYIVPAGTEGGVGDSLLFCGNGINRMNTGFEPAAATAHARAPFGGLWINKLYAAFQAQPEWNTRLEVMYIRDTTDNGNTIGNAVKTGTATPRDDNDIGWEIDWLNTLAIYKNLSFQFGGGILFAGDAMDYRVGATTTNDSPKNPWAITTNLTYSF